MRLDCSRAVAGAAVPGLLRPGYRWAAAWLVCMGCRTPGAPGLSQHLGNFASPVGKYRVGAGAENA